jgi:hypothetical protein
MVEHRYWIAFCLVDLAVVAIVLAVLNSAWLIFAAVPFTFGAFACLAPRGWLSNGGYRRALNILAYLCMIPALISMAAAVGLVPFAIVALGALCTFVFVMWMSRRPATRALFD